jgi:GNAT superfamily N-acetyltransferase
MECNMFPEIEIRRASAKERDALRHLQAASLREMARTYYDDEAIAGFIEHVGTMDDRLIEDGTYFAAFYYDQLAGCGGWTAGRPSYFAHAKKMPPKRPQSASVHSIFVHPTFARRGIASRLVQTIETRIAEAGLTHARVATTLNSVPFYSRAGYRADMPLTLEMPGATLFPGLAMEKDIARPAYAA